MKEKISLAHGAGGTFTRQLMQTVIVRHLHNQELGKQEDASLLPISTEKAAFTTDSYVVDPLFFEGGDIGKLAVCGTVNDLSVAGADPQYLSAGFIIEEGFPISDLESIVKSMGNTSFECGVKIVSADIKVVPQGKGNGLYINTAGIGLYSDNGLGGMIEEGDKVILSGTLGEHELAVILARNRFRTDIRISSDCTPLNALTRTLFASKAKIKQMKDPSRGGLVTALYKWVDLRDYGIILNASKIPISAEVESLSKTLGLDPLHLSNQGKMVLIASENETDKILQIMRNNPIGRQSAIIGEVSKNVRGRVVLNKQNGEEVILGMKSGMESIRVC